MKRLLAIIIVIGSIFATGTPASAQTSTPTPGPLCGAGYYEQTASCVIYSSGWSTTSNAVYSGGSLASTTTVGSNLTFRMYGTVLVLYRTLAATATTANFCVDAACQTISWVAGSTINMTALAFNVDCLTVCNISITHNGAGGTAINLDAFAIFANSPTSTPITPQATWTNQVVTQIPYPTQIPFLATWTAQVPATWTAQPTNRAFTPLPTWTEQPTARAYTQVPYPTPLATWTAQAVAAAPTPTNFVQGQYVLSGYGTIDDSDQGITYVGEWSIQRDPTDNDLHHVTTSQASYMTFTTTARIVQLMFRTNPAYDDIEVCWGSGCTIIDTNASIGYDIETIFSDASLIRTISFSIRKANNNSNPIYIDGLIINGFNTPVPVSTWTPFPTPAPQFTQIAPLTEIPQFTQIPPLTQIPLPETWTPFPTNEPQFTQLPYPTPLATWTEQPYGGYTAVPQFTQLPYPTPLDTWTPQAVAMVVITLDGITFDWNGLMTIFPTLITQVPATFTPTETLTPSITPTPSVTPTPTPPGYVQYELPNAEGTPVMTGVLYVEMTAGDLANNVMLFVMALMGVLGFAYSLWQGRKGSLQ